MKKRKKDAKKKKSREGKGGVKHFSRSQSSLRSEGRSPNMGGNRRRRSGPDVKERRQGEDNVYTTGVARRRKLGAKSH